MKFSFDISVEAERRLYLLLVIAAAIAIGVLFGLIVHEQKQITHQTQVIQEQRYDSAIRRCEDVNDRHARTLDALTALLANGHSSNPQHTQSIIVPLVNAILPYRDCKKFAEAQVQSHFQMP